jgi:hypothetical protein
MAASFIPENRPGTPESLDYEKMSYCSVISNELFSEVVAYESNLGLRVPIVEEISCGIDFLMGKAIQRLRDGYSVEHQRGRLMPTLELLGEYFAVIL